MQIFVTNRVFFNMFKIGLENRDFCKSLHFYIETLKKKKKKKKKRKKKKSCICWLVQLLSALRASPEGQCPHYFFLGMRGACQRPDRVTGKKNQILGFGCHIFKKLNSSIRSLS